MYFLVCLLLAAGAGSGWDVDACIGYVCADVGVSSYGRAVLTGIVRAVVV